MAQLSPSLASAPPAHWHVAILLCTYQGEAYLAEQLDSIAAQTHPHWTLWVSDDGSSDGTTRILEHYQRRWGRQRLRLRLGPQRGFAANFNSLLADADIQADAFALADQDDIWHADKLARAVAWLATAAAEAPSLYAARTRLVDAKGFPIGLSPPCRAPGFANALVQNIASGNTMVLNAAARRRLVEAGLPEVGLHDWWCYLWISGIGGLVYFDPDPCLDYRQHGGNQIGMRAGWSSIWPRVKRLWQGQHRQHLDSQLNALQARQAWLTPSHRQQLQCFQAARRQRALARLYGFWRAGVYRQSRLGQWALYVAAILNKS
ncbi:glycosyltransferase family 2 protein [Halomonas ventosae]|uniref:Glycosyl transferase family 2 n=1 Tax=Halomonas ventosae TaxID=229007 RepID=A0A4R6HNS4_9GAMM|nr:glycosyltransferase family 2 protein [Halomonas ventosae]TDO10653.1 glycosyl transferase family 2 [Halomonas ventosae]